MGAGAGIAGGTADTGGGTVTTGGTGTGTGTGATITTGGTMTAGPVGRAHGGSLGMGGMEDGRGVDGLRGRGRGRTARGTGGVTGTGTAGGMSPGGVPRGRRCGHLLRGSPGRGSIGRYRPRPPSPPTFFPILTSPGLVSLPFPIWASFGLWPPEFQ